MLWSAAEETLSRQPHPLCWLAVRLALLASVAASSVGAAEDLERARAVFHEGLVLEVAGDWASALAKFQEVGRTRLTPQVRYHLARCKEHLGRLTEALGDYRVAEAEARAAGLAESGEMERARRDLEARVPTLTLRGNPAVLGLEVELDGILLGSAVYDRPMVINPGQHQITVRRPHASTRTLLITAEETQRIDVDLRERGSSSLVENEPPSNSADLRQSVAAPTWAYIAAGAGAAAVVTSVVLFVVRHRALDELESKCVDQVCPSALQPVERRGEVASTMAPIALGFGIAGLGLGAWGFWGGMRRGASTGGRRTSSVISAGGLPASWGVNIAGEF